MCLAIPGKVVSVEGDDIMRTARVDFGGVVKEINLAYTPDAKPGDYLLVHVGFAISKIDEVEARKVFEDLEQIDKLEGGRGEPAVAGAA